MPRYEVTVDGKRFEVEAPDEQTAKRAALEAAQPRNLNTQDMARGFQAGVARGAIAPMIATSPVGLLAQGADTISRFMGRGGVPTPEGLARSLAGGNYQPTTREGRAARAAGDLLPALATPGGVIPRVAAYASPLVAGEVGAEIATRAGGNEEIGRVGGQLVGALGGAVRQPPPRKLPSGRRAPPVPARARQAMQIINDRAPQDAREMQRRIEQFRAAGIEPALVDVLDESGRGFVRAAASRMTPMRDEAQRFADSRALDMADRVSQQARRIMSADARTPDEIAEQLTVMRASTAKRAIDPVRGRTVTLSPEAVEGLRTPIGRRAIQEAAARERDATVRAALARLADDVLDNPSVPITVGMADRISRVLGGKAQAAFREGDNDLGATYKVIADAIRQPTRQAVPEYDSALRTYAAQSRAIDTAERGERFLNNGTDEFVAAMRTAPDEVKGLARATARRAVEAASGSGPGTAPAVARKLALAREQRMRNRALLGPDDARKLEEAMQREYELVRNAKFVAPNEGPGTAQRTQDALQAAAVFDAVTEAATGNYGMAFRRWLSQIGMSDQEAAEVVRLAISPVGSQQAFAIIQAKAGPAAAQQFLLIQKEAALLSAGAAAAPQLGSYEQRRRVQPPPRLGTPASQ